VKTELDILSTVVELSEQLVIAIIASHALSLKLASSPRKKIVQQTRGDVEAAFALIVTHNSSTCSCQERLNERKHFAMTQF
jgi:hypothetical protein